MVGVNWVMRERVGEAALKMRFWVKLVVIKLIRVHNVSFYTTCPLAFFIIGTYIYPPGLPFFFVYPEFCFFGSRKTLSFTWVFVILGKFVNESPLCVLYTAVIFTESELIIITQKKQQPTSLRVFKKLVFVWAYLYNLVLAIYIAEQIIKGVFLLVSFITNKDGWKYCCQEPTPSFWCFTSSRWLQAFWWWWPPQENW